MVESEHVKQSPDKLAPAPQKAGNETDAAPGFSPLRLATGDGTPPNTPRRILQLQRLIGNRATIKLLQRDGTGTATATAPVSGGGSTPATADAMPPIPAAEAAPAAAPDLSRIVLTDEEYQNAFKIYQEMPNWIELKAHYIDELQDRRTMSQLWAFRRQYVVSLIKNLRSASYPNLLAKSAGSNDLASDYDITIASPGNDNDVKAIDDFNKIVKGDFGAQPGTVFDTNLYAKDYGAISQSDEFKDAGQTYATDTAPGHTAAMAQVEEDVQDVAALIKVRRFMNQGEWDAYVADLLRQVTPDKQAAVSRKYDEADGIYQICVAELLGQVREALGDEVEHVEEEHEEASLADAQASNAGELDHAAHDHSDTVLEQSNDLYIKRMTKIRQIQSSLTQLESQMATLEALGDVTPELGAMVERMFNNPNRNLPERIEAGRSQVKQMLGEAIFFAAEAYISQGAIRHVVAGIQGAKLSDAEKRETPDRQAELLRQKREKANNGLTMGDLMQSFNEQLGDFLKDYGHLSGKSDSVFYIKSAKYVDRMLDVLVILRNRMGAAFPKPLGIERTTHVSLDNIVAGVKELYSARADPTTWGASRESHSLAVALNIGIESRAHWKMLLINLGSEVTALIRNQMPAAADGGTEMSFFQNRDTSQDAAQ